MFDDIDFDPAEFVQRIRLPRMMGQRMPSPRRAGNIDRAINPIERERNDPRRVRLQGQLGEFKEIAHLGRKSEFLIIAQGIWNFRLFGLKPKFLMLQLRFQF